MKILKNQETIYTQIKYTKITPWLQSGKRPNAINNTKFRGAPSAKIEWHGVTKEAFVKASEERGHENPRRKVDLMKEEKMKTSLSQLQLPKRVTDKGEVLVQETVRKGEPTSALFEFLESGKIERETKLPLVTRTLITEDPVRSMLQKLPKWQIMRYVW